MNNKETEDKLYANIIENTKDFTREDFITEMYNLLKEIEEYKNKDIMFAKALTNEALLEQKLGLFIKENEKFKNKTFFKELCEEYNYLEQEKCDLEFELSSLKNEKGLVMSFISDLIKDRYNNPSENDIAVMQELRQVLEFIKRGEDYDLH